MMNTYRTFLERYIHIDSQEWQLIQSQLKLKEFKKGEIIHYEGDICNELLFLKTGIIRAYTMDIKAKDFTWYIYFNDATSNPLNIHVVDYASFIDREASRLSFEVLEDAKCISIHHKDIELFYSIDNKWQIIGRKMAELAYSHVHHKVLSYQTLSAKERYIDFIKTSAYLLDKVPQYHIASYLGIAPQSLSRIKTQLDSQM